MSILAIDTALDACSVAIVDQAAGVRTIVSRPMVTGHAEAFFDSLDAAFDAASQTTTSMAAIGVTVGPGSFTGLRVGLAAAKALAFAFDCPLHGVTTLSVFAQEFADSDRPVAVLIDARRGAFYRQVFAGGVPLADPETVPADDPFAGLNKACAVTGPGIMPAAADHEVLVCPRHLPVAAIADMVAAKSQLLPAKPAYLREADAKPQTRGLLVRA